MHQTKCSVNQFTTIRHSVLLLFFGLARLPLAFLDHQTFTLSFRGIEYCYSNRLGA